jgi:predicted nucleic acid-binding protein
MPKVFLDTNVLVYACDQDNPEKQAKARSLLRLHAAGDPPCISTQVLQEFYVAATRKLGIEPLRVKAIMATFRNLETALVDQEDILRAIDGNILLQISFWDALIIVAAHKLRCDVIYSEDLNHGQNYNGLLVQNPFRRGL